MLSYVLHNYIIVVYFTAYKGYLGLENKMWNSIFKSDG